MVPVADKQESVVLAAIARAASKYAPHEWFGLPPSQRTRAIYRELRQLDAALAASGRLQEVASARQTVLANSERT
jgi:hypothetical protein